MFAYFIVLIPFIAGASLSNPFLQEPEDVETIIGSTVILPCRTEPIDGSQVTWCKNDFCTLGKTRDLPFYPRYEIIGQAQQGEHHFKIVNVSLEDMGTYQCQIRAGPRRAGSMSRKVKLTVLQIPTSLTIDSPVVLVENVLSFVVCRANNGMPEAKLSWHLPPSISYLSKNDYALLSDQSLRNSISNITFLPSRAFHGKLIRCQAHSTAIEINNQTMIAEQYIQTIYAPEINLTVTGELTEGQLVTMDCLVSSRPSVDRIRWLNGSSLLNSSSAHRLQLNLTRYMHGNQIFCQAANSVGRRNQSRTLQVNYKPVFINSKGNPISTYSVVLLDEGQSVELHCAVDSFPSSSISWIFNKQIIDGVQVINRTGLYTCRAQHPIFGVFNRTIRVALKGPPEMIEETTSHSVYVGQTAQFVCSISKDIPAEERWWSRDGQGKLIANDKYQLSENASDRLIESRLIIKNVVSADEDYYICTTRNQYGSSLVKFQLRVISSKSVLLYGSISLGLACSLVLISCVLMNYWRVKSDRRIRKRSSTTDETISSLAKQADQMQHDEQDEINSNLDQYLFHEQLRSNDRNEWNDSPRDEQFFFRDHLERFSTVV